MKCSKCKLIGHNKRTCQTESDISSTLQLDKNVIYKIDENDISNINNASILVGNSFKTIDELKTCTDSRKVILYITHLKPGAIKDYLSMWLYESHYSKQSMRGNLTDRIKKINNGICYTQIMKRCFNAYDIKKNMSSTSILDTKATSIVKDLYDVCPSMCGSFIDYLIRRIISELTNRPFSDSRANKILKPDNIITNCPDDTNIWEHIDNRNQEVWTMRKDPILSLPVICEIKQKDTFLAFEKNKEWLRIDYNGISGWVRWKLPKEGDDTDNIDLMIENPYLKVKDHICSSGCKYIVEQSIYFGQPEYINSCSLKSCQYISYENVKDTAKYKTKDILNDILAISLCHTEAFGYCPKQETFDAFHTKLNGIIIDDLLDPLTEMCKTLIHDKKNILLNPVLGGPLNNLENTSIPSDADLVIDDTLYDIKCTRTTNTGKEYYELLQLLGYSGLLLLNKKYEHRINNMIILNILEGTSTKFNISYLEKDNFVKYIQQLTNMVN